MNVKVSSKEIIQNDAVRRAIEDAERQLDGSGRVLVRPSGTEPKIRVMAEGQDRERIEAVAQEIANVIKRLDG